MCPPSSLFHFSTLDLDGSLHAILLSHAAPGSAEHEVIDFTVTGLIAEERTAPRRPELREHVLTPTQGISIVASSY